MESLQTAVPGSSSIAQAVVVGLVCGIILVCVLGEALLVLSHVRGTQALGTSDGRDDAPKIHQPASTSIKHLRRRAEDQPRRISISSQVASMSDMFDTFESGMSRESIDSQTVQSILGSVDERQVHETQILLSSCNWDLDELLQREIDSNDR
ncbi:hypothetical protein TSOC_007300 [Tetrabaena socialis]|uniref:Transmembrane protein n=1 Tax=Tetrabaena socialis TaxID=47790 RepID=A0A2J8A1D4_9CHLO|nr:hypothetical protein TSOC_007300 [Tetrabaena socialis]|eukprot:PNH06331.1 hypothetical protein TSOC_007300 [Tetrabaena socialis]